MDISLEQLSAPKQGINYLVPQEWWEDFYHANLIHSNQNNYSFPQLNLINYVDTFLFDFEEDIISQIEHKCNFIKFTQVRLNPEIHSIYSWKAISPQMWKIINKKLNLKRSVMTYFSNQDQTLALQNLKQVQIVFCSKNRSDAFIGYLPPNASMVGVIREIGYQMGFVEVDRSKITFPQKTAQKCYTFNEFDQVTLSVAPDILIMAFNMERFDDDECLPYFGEPQVQRRILNESNEAVVGDLNTMIDLSRQNSNNNLNQRIHDRTLSTGAETPFSFILSQGFDLGKHEIMKDRQYRVNELFGSKQPEQIQEMKAKAKFCIQNGQQIKVAKDFEHFETKLSSLAEEVIEQIMKKKNYKEKDHLE